MATKRPKSVRVKGHGRSRPGASKTKQVRVKSGTRSRKRK